MRTTKRSWLTLSIAVLVSTVSLTPGRANADDNMVRVSVSTSEQLVSAVQNANTSGVPTVIKLSPGQYQFATGFEITGGFSALPPITGTVTLVGKDSATTVLDGQGGKRLVTVESTGHVTVKNLTLTNGRVTAPVSSLFTVGGGAVANYGGFLRLENSVISNSRTSADEGVGVSVGGGVASFGGRLVMRDTTVTGNITLGAGPGVGIVAGEGIIRRSLITNNRTSFGFGSSGVSSGGGLYVGDADVVVWDSTIAGNRTGFEIDEWFGSGGGISNGGRLWLVNTAVKENAAAPMGLGGGILNSGELTIIDSTIADNLAESSGGGVLNAGTLKLKGATLSGNVAQGGRIVGEAPGGPFPDPDCFLADLSKCNVGGGGIWNETGTVIAVRSLIAGNGGPDPAEVGKDCMGPVISKGRNALGDSRACVLTPQSAQTPADLVDVDPLIGALADDGSPGNAHFPILAGSPLIDAGGKVTKSSCTSHDQLRQERVDGDGDGKIRCDIGAVEFVP
jgi:hypothetical protein